MVINKDLLVEQEAFFIQSDNSNVYQYSSGEFCDYYLIRQLRLETLRAQRSKSTLSIILLTLNKEANLKFLNMNEILGIIKKKTRDTDISGFINHKTICVILPDTDEAGAKEICAKLANRIPQFSATTSSYPDHLFESLTKNGYIKSDAFPFEIWDPADLKCASKFKYILKRVMDIVGSIIGILVFMPVMLVTALAIKVTSPGPVIFSQIRLGKHGAPFTFYKFRSMHVNMDNQLHRDYVHDFIKDVMKKSIREMRKNQYIKLKPIPE